ncbi:MAG: hypothetical protein R3E12_17355 [Candidatus Eisenbacteria bacterium]
MVGRDDVPRYADRRHAFSGNVITINPDSLSRRTTLPAGGSSMGAAIVTALQLENGTWSLRWGRFSARRSGSRRAAGLTKNLSENPANLIPLIFLAGVAFLFVLVEVLTLGMVMSLGGASAPRRDPPGDDTPARGEPPLSHSHRGTSTICGKWSSRSIEWPRI